jgi:hypothetical protein
VQPGASTFGPRHLVVHAIAAAPAAYLMLPDTMDILRWAAGIVVTLGLISLLTVVVVRRAHRGASWLFFGLTGLAVLGNTVFELCTIGSYGSTVADIMNYGIRGVLLLVSTIGITMGRRITG